jgi:hypothetical protein
MSVCKSISKKLRNKIIEQIQQKAEICIAVLANTLIKNRVLVISQTCFFNSEERLTGSLSLPFVRQSI